MEKLANLLLLMLLLSYSSAEYFDACSPSSNGDFLSLENSCYTYIYCNGSDSFQDDCPLDAYFDAAAQECVFSEDFKCETHVSENFAVIPTATISPTTATSAAPHEVVARPKCSLEKDEYFAHEQRCEYYYKCTRGYFSILRCNIKYGWDHLKQFCRPIEQANCYRPKT